jgi:DNA-binding MarR family transcriptional regulator
MALRYFARANTFSRTPSAFAEFQATTRGTASQAIKALEAGGYLVRQRSKADGRSVSLRLTSKGKKALARDPFEVLVRAVDLLDAKERTAMHHAMHQSEAAQSGEGLNIWWIPLEKISMVELQCIKLDKIQAVVGSPSKPLCELSDKELDDVIGELARKLMKQFKSLSGTSPAARDQFKRECVVMEFVAAPTPKLHAQQGMCLTSIGVADVLAQLVDGVFLQGRLSAQTKLIGYGFSRRVNQNDRLQRSSPFRRMALCDDRVVDVLREFVANRLADLYVGLADQIVGDREPG